MAVTVKGPSDYGSVFVSFNAGERWEIDPDGVLRISSDTEEIASFAQHAWTYVYKGSHNARSEEES